MSKNLVPRQPLLDELLIFIIQINKDLRVAESMLRFMNGERGRIGWMFTPISHRQQLENLNQLRHRALEIDTLLKELMAHLLEFSAYPTIQKNLIQIHQEMKKVPSVDQVHQLLSLGGDLFQDTRLSTPYLAFVTQLMVVYRSAVDLRHLLFEEALTHLSLSVTKSVKALGS